MRLDEAGVVVLSLDLGRAEAQRGVRCVGWAP